jgi:hypothetical protein
MYGARKAKFKQTYGEQQATSTKYATEREKIAGDIEGIYSKTKEKVETRLKKLETEVTNSFEKSVDFLQKEFEKEVREVAKLMPQKIGHLEHQSGLTRCLWKVANPISVL